jgi:hypothetical protein
MSGARTIPRGALQCPFCGSDPLMERWHGGGPNKRMVSCDNEECDVAPMVTGESVREAVEKWNTRAPARV